MPQPHERVPVVPLESPPYLVLVIGVRAWQQTEGMDVVVVLLDPQGMTAARGLSSLCLCRGVVCGGGVEKT